MKNRLSEEARGRIRERLDKLGHAKVDIESFLKEIDLSIKQALDFTPKDRVGEFYSDRLKLRDRLNRTLFDLRILADVEPEYAIVPVTHFDELPKVYIATPPEPGSFLAEFQNAEVPDLEVKIATWAESAISAMEEVINNLDDALAIAAERQLTKGRPKSDADGLLFEIARHYRDYIGPTPSGRKENVYVAIVDIVQEDLNGEVGPLPIRGMEEASKKTRSCFAGERLMQPDKIRFKRSMNRPPMKPWPDPPKEE